MRKRLLAAGAVTVFLLSSGLAEADVGQKTSTSLANSGYCTIKPYKPSQNLGYDKRSYLTQPSGSHTTMPVPSTSVPTVEPTGGPTGGTTENQGNTAGQPSGNSGNMSQPSNKQWISVAVASGASAPSDASAPPGVGVKSGDQREYFTPSTPTRVPQGALDRLANGLESLKNVFARVLQMS